MSHDAAHIAFILALSEADSPMLLWLILGGVFALGPVLHSYIKVYEWFRGKSVDTSQFVTRAELDVIKAQRDRQVAETLGAILTRMGKLDDLVNDLGKDFSSIHRALGRLEGHDDVQIKSHR